MSTRQLGFVALAFLLGMAFSRLVVYGPQELKDKFKYSEFQIPASYANFGNIPYGQSLVSPILILILRTDRENIL